LSIIRSVRLQITACGMESCCSGRLAVRRAAAWSYVLGVRCRRHLPSHQAHSTFRVQNSAGKVLASIFWDQDGIFLIDYLPKGQTINTEYYSSLLVQLKHILREKRRPRPRTGAGRHSRNGSIPAGDIFTDTTTNKVAYDCFKYFFKYSTIVKFINKLNTIINYIY
jgi:hypothetical protein